MPVHGHRVTRDPRFTHLKGLFLYHSTTHLRDLAEDLGQEQGAPWSFSQPSLDPRGYQVGPGISIGKSRTERERDEAMGIWLRDANPDIIHKCLIAVLGSASICSSLLTHTLWAMVKAEMGVPATYLGHPNGVPKLLALALAHP